MFLAVLKSSNLWERQTKSNDLLFLTIRELQLKQSREAGVFFLHYA